MHNETQAETLWLSDKDLATRYGVSRVSIWRWSRSGQFPPPRKLSARITRWSAAEVDAHDQRKLGAEA
ncbi:MAG: AlpA family phage regulatory protein [Spiribacter salinus]|uniref:AlpA family phage regulatory protein n=1 Tax=Spiribacter salinus TaxID=1335746 RepID=A0A540VNC3_9GAMM|nr:MAG: AlpA family phage regulatory protein [Spiribacter salinus]